MSANRIDPTPVRISTNVSIDRQTPKTDFGDRVNAGLNNAANAVGSGLSTVAPLVPGGPILSAAVSSMGNVTAGATAGQSIGAQYGSGALGIAAAGATPLSTTVGGVTSLPTTGADPTGIGGVGTGASAGLPISQTGVGLAGVASIQDMAAQQARLLNVQIAMQNESQVFSTVSNVLKVRHDTVKNTIQNVH